MRAGWFRSLFQPPCSRCVFRVNSPFLPFDPPLCRRLWWSRPHHGPYAPYSRAKVYNGLWRRFMLHGSDSWDKGTPPARISSADTVNKRLDATLSNLSVRHAVCSALCRSLWVFFVGCPCKCLVFHCPTHCCFQRRTPPSLFSPADRQRLLYRMLRSALWLDGDAPSFEESAGLHTPAGVLGSGGRTSPGTDLKLDYYGPDLYLVHDAKALASVAAHWDDVKDLTWQSVFERDGAAEQRFVMCTCPLACL